MKLHSMLYIRYIWKMIQRFLKTLGIIPPYDPAIPLLGTYPEETKIERDTSIPLFIAAVLKIARTWKQPRCPSTDKWIKKLWYIYTKKYYSAIKRNAFESILMRWMKLLLLLLSHFVPTSYLFYICQGTYVSLPVFFPTSCPHICSLCLCFYSCPANRFICIIFLDSTYIC